MGFLQSAGRRRSGRDLHRPAACFDLHVQRLRGLEAELAQIELLDNVEHLQGCEALRIGAHGIDIHAAVVADERLVPLGTMLAEILRREPATDALEIGVDGFWQWGRRKRCRVRLGDHAIGAGKIRIAANVVFVGSYAAGRIGCHGIGCFFNARSGMEKGRHIRLR